MGKSYTTKKPTGLSIKRSGNTLVVTWKIGDKDYFEGQILQYKFGSGKWTTAASIGTRTVSKSIPVPVANYYPNTKQGLSKVYIRIRGRRKDYESGNNTINPKVSEWATKDFDVLVPNKPTVTCELSGTDNNVSTFTWNTTVSTETYAWFNSVELQTCLLTASNITDGAKVPARSWTVWRTGGATGSASITEDTSVINDGQSHTRWVRIRGRGPRGATTWNYTRHVYAVPYQTKNVTASAKTTEAGGYLCTTTWDTPRDAAHPVDKINVQYAFAVPTSGMGCPDGASWTDAQTLAYKDGSDASAFSVDSVVGTDQCLFVRINTVHDRNTTYGAAVSAAVGALSAPTGLSVSTDATTHRATITATNASQVEDSFLVVKYMTADDPNGFDIGVIPHGQTSVTVQCPEFSSASAIRFAVYAVVGAYTATTRADGVSSYAIAADMTSSTVEYGGTVPAAPTSVTLAQSGSGVRVTFDWAWSEATQAELSWSDNEDAWESTASPSTYLISNTHASTWTIANLEMGKTWYVRVRLASGVGENQTFGAYSDTVSIDLSSTPTVPVLSLSEGVITEYGSVTASWSYASTDGSTQAYATIAEVVTENNVTTYNTIAEVETAQHVTISAVDAEWVTGNTYDLAVCVTSDTGKRSEWSDIASVVIAEPISVTITSTSLVEQTVTDDSVSRTVMSLTEMPLTATITGAGIGGTTTLILERAETYHISRPDETEINGFEGETIAIYSQIGEDQITINNDDLIGHLDDGATYRLIATVHDGLGQSAEVSQMFEVHWTHQAIIPDAFVNVLNDETIAVLSPIAPDGAISTDVCDIYRLSVDKPELIYPDATFGETYVDPFPAIGAYGGHRFVFKTANGDYITDDNEIAWLDMTESEGDILHSDYNIIDFGTGRVMLAYNVDLSNSWAKDFTETKYLGGHVQGDWNPAVSRTGTISAVAVSDDAETIEAMRRLAAYAGICHVRTKDGSSYAADVQVSETHSQDTAHKLVSFSLKITRVDTETYDGMTYAEWVQTGGLYGS